MLAVISIIPKESSDIRKSRLCSAQFVRQLRSKGCKSPNNQKGQSSGPCRLCGGLEKVCHVVPTALLVRVQCSRKSLHMVVEGMSTRHIAILMFPRSYCRHRWRFTIFVPATSKFVNKITVKDWVEDSFCNIFLKRYGTEF